MKYLMSLYTGNYHKNNKTKVPDLKKVLINNTKSNRGSTGTHFSMNMGSIDFQQNNCRRKRFEAKKSTFKHLANK